MIIVDINKIIEIVGGVKTVIKYANCCMICGNSKLRRNHNNISILICKIDNKSYPEYCTCNRYTIIPDVESIEKSLDNINSNATIDSVWV
jgi:hypothetical protein